ncbi:MULTISPECIES: sigma-70 family RNA polymerase sigma factor [Streptomyces]|nr:MULTISPECIES: sigma-70 family RNA polymerase sigma factor [Streptomyces]MCX4662099.1 sigma-70 family RNA polymerase sigma factor [Streptomyces uncialis]WST71955.1 sigma-70 family RNA polymerase sigma factor [Streptomyces uncialis]WTE09362.1 sigma-70 family RNA polymerase sigma factor [Streptomyces uncialis]SCK06935.1 RNA polymerase sigma-70 factor, ECF subfamily [Streptomyces sp. AmelKG-E11A]
MNQNHGARTPRRLTLMPQAPPLDFSAFHQMHRPAYLRYARAFLRNRADAEEAVDAAFEKLLRKWPQVLRSDSPDRYAWAVLRNHVADHNRGRRPETQPLDEAAFDTVALRTSSDPIAQLEESLTLMRAVRQLPDRQQDVTVLRYLLDLPVDRIADELGISQAAVRSTDRHARRRLREILGPDRSMEGRNRE